MEIELSNVWTKDKGSCAGIAEELMRDFIEEVARTTDADRDAIKN